MVDAHRTVDDGGSARRRFAKVSTLAAAVVTVPYLWILWSLWGPVNPLRQTIYEDNFYDLQARAMFAGHLWIPNGSIGIEGFFHAGREYTYFGIFPSILRMPVLLVTNHLDARLTAPSMLVAWFLTALVVPLLAWRVRILVRGDAPLGWSETVGYGVLIAALLGGTVLMQLASDPYVFSEDLAWSVCLALTGMFLLLGILQDPTRRRVVLALVVLVAANLNRVTTGWALAGSAVLVAGYFALGRGGSEKRKWAPALLAVGLVPLAVGSAINYAKFGTLFGVSNLAQEWTRVNAYRRKFLASNHDSESGTAFIPTTVLTYLRPDGVHLSSVFPFVTLPTSPPKALGGVLFDRLYRTASIPSSMPLAFLLGCWGVVTAFRPRSVGQVHLTRILLLGAAGAGALLFGWGYIADRYLADFLPFFVLAALVGMADLWRRLEGKRPPVRRTWLVGIVVLGIFSVTANIGSAITPNEEWSAAQTLSFVQAQKTLADLTGQSLRPLVRSGTSLPPWAPAGQLFVVDDCAGLYVSNGENYSTVPAQLYTRTTWQVVERGTPFLHAYRVTFGTASSLVSTELVSAGSDSAFISTRPSMAPGRVLVTVALYSGSTSLGSESTLEAVGSIHQVQVVSDTAKHVLGVGLGESAYVATTLVGGPIEDHVSPASVGSDQLVVTHSPPSSTATPLCRSLTR